MASSTAGNYSFPGVFHSSARPCSRYRSAFAQERNGAFWIFGGIANAGVLSDVWTWNGGYWKLAAGSSAGNSRPLLSADGPYPGATAYAAAWQNADGGFQIFGGSAYTSTKNGTLTAPSLFPAPFLMNMP